ncbi:helix-turn-helix domain-containing protein [Streptomyces sp. NPDC058623]|uniref:helix-turn-helix domain-containing protein n=1 Tax=Streptomyces sp. NPDC058623 TaxID=3346563 RepID=UPI0036585DB0
MSFEGELPSSRPSKEDVELAKRVFGERLRMLREQIGFSRPRLAGKLGIDQATIAGYENQTKRRTPTPRHNYVLSLLDEVQLCTRESDVSPTAISDTLTMYRALLELRIRTDRNSDHAKVVLEAFDKELALRTNDARLKEAEAAYAALKDLKQGGTDVPDAAIEDQRRAIEQLGALVPILTRERDRADLALTRIPDPEEPPTCPAPELGHGGTVTTFGGVQSRSPAPTPAPKQPSRRVLGAAVVLLLGGFLIYRLTAADAGSADGAIDGKPVQPSTSSSSRSPAPTPPPPKPSPTPSAQDSPSSSQEAPSAPEQSPSVLLPEKKVFVYQTVQDVYVGYESRSIDFDLKPPGEEGTSGTKFDLETLRSEGSGVVLSRHFDAWKLVKTPAGFQGSFANCTALLNRELGNSDIAARQGDSFCFTTTQKRMVYATITQVLPAPSNRNNRVVVNATVWEDPATVDTQSG